MDEKHHDPEHQERAANEAWLQKHHKIFAPLLIILALAVFVLPWIFFSFMIALGIQVVGIGVIYMLGRAYTNAFHDNKIF